MELKEHKKEIRKAIRGLKKDMGEAALLEKSLAVQHNLFKWIDFSPYNTILLYHALPDEVNTNILLQTLSNRLEGDKRIILPVVSGDILILKEYIPDEVATGYMNILEPQEGQCIDPSEIELAVIPGVAFDKNCNRMGRGKGFYDKLLPHINCKTIGLGFDFQIVDTIPCEPFDKTLDMVVTENNCYSSPL